MIDLIPDRYLHKPVIITEKHSLSYRELISCILSTYRRLSEAGIRPGHRVGVVSQNSVEYVILIMTLLSMGAISVPINTRWQEAQIRDVVEDIKCDHLIISKEMKRFELGSKQILLDELIDKGKKGFFKRSEIDLDNEATMIFTSGSAGKPKAVLHSFKNHYYSALGSNMNISFGPGDLWGIFLPLYHVGGLSILFRAIVSGGAMAISKEKRSLAESIKKLGITHISLVPTQLYRVLKDPEELKTLQRLKAILLGGAPAGKNLVIKAKEFDLNIYTTYGCTEMASQVTTTAPNDTLEHLFTSGRLLPYRELLLSSDGEIMVRGQTLFKGYWSKEGIHKPFTKEGWFKTGDLGHLNRDGYLIVDGRKDNMFISGGENIQPEEIEQRLMQIDGITDAVVVPVKSEEWGQRPVAFVCLDKKIEEGDIKKVLENYLPRYKIPDRIFYLPEQYDENRIKLNRGYLKGVAERIMERA